METFFKRLEYHFLVKSTATEIASFPHKSPLSKANVKTNEMGSAK